MTKEEFDKLKEKLKVYLKGYKRMNGKLISNLEELGFELIRDKKHCIFHYKVNGKIFIFEFAKTPSDQRAGIKKTFDIISTLRPEVRA